MASWSRRQFLQRSVGAAASLELAGHLAGSDETTHQALSAVADPLLLPRGKTPAADANALPLLVRAAARMTDEPTLDPEVEADLDSGRFGTERVQQYDREYLAWVDANQESLELVAEAMQRDELFYGDEPWSDERAELIQGYRSLLRAAIRQADREAAAGNLGSAAKHALNAEKAFRLLRDGGCMVVEYITQCADEREVLRLIRRLAYDRRGDGHLVAGILARLPAEIQPVEGLRRSIRSEFHSCLVPEVVRASRAGRGELFATLLNKNFFDKYCPEGEYDLRCAKLERLFAGHPNSFDPVATVKRASAEYAGWLRNVELPLRVHQKLPEDRPDADLAAWPEQLMLDGTGKSNDLNDVDLEKARQALLSVPNPVGRMLAMTDFSINRVHCLAVGQEAAFHGTRLFLAIRQFELEHGSLPSALPKLVEARILPSLPRDPFSGGVYGYSPERRVLWSVGNSGQVSASLPDKNIFSIGDEDCRWELRPATAPHYGQ